MPSGNQTHDPSVHEARTVYDLDTATNVIGVIVIVLCSTYKNDSHLEPLHCNSHDYNPCCKFALYCFCDILDIPPRSFFRAFSELVFLECASIQNSFFETHRTSPFSTPHLSEPMKVIGLRGERVVV
jgi:hypothetical protein